MKTIPEILAVERQRLETLVSAEGGSAEAVALAGEGLTLASTIAARQFMGEETGELETQLRAVRANLEAVGSVTIAKKASAAIENTLRRVINVGISAVIGALPQ